MTDLIALAKQAGMGTSITLPDVYLFNPTTLQAFADLIRADEKEELAKFCEGHQVWVGQGKRGLSQFDNECEGTHQGMDYARAIRARTTT